MASMREKIGDIPVRIEMPARISGPLVLWMPHLSGSAEKEQPMLDRFAELGHPAVSFDPVLHGERGDGSDRWAFALSVLGAFRARMWPIVGQTVLDAMAVLDWAADAIGIGEGVLAGGVSMGGDVAVALAGVDPRSRRVAALGSTPDWTRPDMRSLTDPDMVIDQGEASVLGQWFCDQFNPAGHLDRYRRGVPMLFELGSADFHIPAAHAAAFRHDLLALDQAAGDAIQISVRDGLDHAGITASDAALDSAVRFLCE